MGPELSREVVQNSVDNHHAVIVILECYMDPEHGFSVTTAVAASTKACSEILHVTLPQKASHP